MWALTGKPAPRIRRIKKGSHMAVSVCGPLKGHLMPPLWVIAGKSLLGGTRNPIEGTKNSRYVVSENGWEDEAAFIEFAHLFVAETKRRNQPRTLLYCDNGDIHLSLVGLEILRRGGCTVKPLVPATTHMTQPLDVSFFGGVKVAVVGLFDKAKITINAYDIPAFFEKALMKMEKLAFDAGKSSALESGFAKARLYPVTPFTDAEYAQSDLLMGLSAGDSRVAAAETLSESEMQRILDSCLGHLSPATQLSVDAVMKAKAETYIAKGMDITRSISLTSEEFTAAKLATSDAKAAAAAAIAARKVDRLKVQAARLSARTWNGRVYSTAAAAAKAAAASAAAAAVVLPAQKKSKAASGAAAAAPASANPYERSNAGKRKSRG